MRADRVRLIGSALLAGSLFAGTAVAAAAGAPLVGRTAPTRAPAAVPAEVAYGARLFAAKGCAACHEIGPVGLVGPGLGDLAVTASLRRPGLSADAYVRESIRRPQAFISPLATGSAIQMPTLEVSDAELDALVAYLLAPH